MRPSPLHLPALLITLLSVTLASTVVSNFSDLKIKTRRSDQAGTMVETLYLKGARQRREYLRDKPAKVRFASISRCDELKRIDLNDDARLYAELPILVWSERRKLTRTMPPAHEHEMTGADVTTTADSVDTGERRQQGAYTARHIKIKIVVESGPGAATPSSVEERDGWYIDLPGLGCQNSTVGVGFATLRPSNRLDRFHFKQLGKAPGGFPIEETVTKTEAGKSMISKVELVEFSEAPLDGALFQVPKGYSPALSTPHGGYDMTRPETLGNRVQVYWAELKDWTRQWF
jgi:hypothetical protein